MSSLKKLEPLPAREQVASLLRKSILSGELRGGQLITLDNIGEQVGMSRTPVREAFQILAGEGLIELRRNRCAVVKGISPKMIRDHFEMRILLEGEAARRACAKGGDIGDIAEAYEEGKIAGQNNDFSQYTVCNQKFHVKIWEHADNEKLKNFLTQLWNGLSRDRHMPAEDYLKVSQTEHDKIMDAMRKQDPEAAQAAMRYHIQRRMEDMLSSFKQP